MRECERNLSESQLGGGVCSSCVEERPASLWRGTNFSLVGKNLTPCGAASESTRFGIGRAGSHAVAVQEADCSLGSAEEEFQPNGEARVLTQIFTDGINGSHRDGNGLSPALFMPLEFDTVDRSKSNPDGTVGNAGSSNLHFQNSSKDSVMVEWTEFHAGRRRNSKMELYSRRPMSRSFDSAEPKPTVDVIMDSGTARRVQIQSNPRVTILKEHKMRSRSMPLENGSAEETALRVIRECLADDLYSDDLDYIANIEAVQDRDGDGYGGAGSLQNKLTGQGCFSPKWQSSHKWVKVLISPMMSRNRVFPSRSKEVRKGKGSSKRLTRFPSSDWSRKDANDEKLSPHWRKQAKTGSKTTIRSSVLSWLQPDAAKPRPKKQKQMEQRTSSSSSCGMSHSGFTDPWLKDLITVGHLHEIAEEHEIFSDDEADNLESINSFGKFLLIAAQRQPQAGLTRISSATF